jgi:hypothetical protein
VPVGGAFAPVRVADRERVVASVYPTAAHLCIRQGGGRTWWAHLEFTRINIKPTILKKEMEDLMNVRGIGEKSFLKLKALVTVTAPKATP